MITKKFGAKEACVIGMMKMPGSHCAESIKSAVESLVNHYKFNTDKVHGNSA